MVSKDTCLVGICRVNFMSKEEDNEMKYNSSPTSHSSRTTAAETIAGAVSSIAAQGWMQHKTLEKPEAILSANELTSLSALIAYVAFQSGENEFGVERKLSDRFNIPNVSCL